MKEHQRRLQISAAKRTIFGKKVKSLRNEGLLPLSFYGKGLESLSLQVKFDEFEKVYRQVGSNQVLNLQIEGEEKLRPVLIHQIQQDPVSSKILHIDFLQVSEKEKMEVEIPLKFVGAAPAVKEGKGVFLELVSKIKVEALPADLPAGIEVDLLGLSAVNQAIKAGALPLPKGVLLKTDPEELVCKIERETVEEEKPAEKPAAPVETSEKPSA